jgi:uncharacterized protein YidB (DUF937 family)
MTMAILALLAFKAVKHMSGSSSSATASPSPSSAGGAAGASAGSDAGGAGAGGLGDLLKGGLGGLLAGGAAGSVISGGLSDLLRQFQQSGHGEAANSWVSQGPNKQISSGDLASALGGDQIDNLMSQSGLSRQELLDGLSRYLPDVVNHLTPDGRLPTESELAGRL